MSQLGLFEAEEIKPVEPKTTVRLGKRAAQVPLARRNREALAKLREVLTKLEGKDIFISQHCSFWWYERLRLNGLKVQWGSYLREQPPCAIVLHGDKGAEVRILWTNRLYQVREQYYGSGKPYYLLDFWNGFWQSPISQYQRNYDCLTITPVK